ncbi:MAG: S46 family peptidase, partial [Bacteroidota bacterium]
LKDAVVSFGGFCYGAMVSPEGLLLTNHHCGYGAIEKQIRRGRNPIRDGYWAEERKEELANPGLTATVLISIRDVTAEMREAQNPELPDGAQEDALTRKKAWLVHSATEGTHYKGEVKPAFEGNRWYLFLTETFEDIRLVGAPPASIARFGGDAAGRVWPMHIADFSLFRIYADSANRPAPYSATNVPYRPRKWCKISLDGLREGDFAMVYGFPGTTEQYLSSYGLEERMETYAPPMLRLREIAMTVLRTDLKRSRRLRTAYEPFYASMQNEETALRSERDGLIRNKALVRKRSYETELAAWVAEDAKRVTQYGKLLWELRDLYTERQKILSKGLFSEAIMSWVGLMEFANHWRKLTEMDPKRVSTRKWQKAKDGIRKTTRVHFKDYHAGTDEKLCLALLEEMIEHLPEGKRPELLDQMEKKYKGDWARYVAAIYKKSALVSREAALDLLRKMKPRQISKIQ